MSEETTNINGQEDNNSNEQNEQPIIGADIMEVARKVTKGNKVLGIIISIVMIASGILLFIMPGIMMYGLELFATIGFVIYGIFMLIGYFTSESENRNGAQIAIGIINILVGLLLWFSNPATMILTFSFLFAVMTLTVGFSKITKSSQLKKRNLPGTGMLILSGILNIILAIFLIVTPLIMTMAIGIIMGVYLIIGGIALLIESISMKSV